MALVVLQLVLVTVPLRAQHPSSEDAAGTRTEALAGLGAPDWVARSISATVELRCLRTDACGTRLATGGGTVSGGLPAAPDPASPEDPSTSPAWLVVGGLLGGGVGMLAGNRVARGLTPGDPDIGTFVLGGSLGASIGIPMGVHIANGGRGDLPPALGTSAALGLASAGVSLGVFLLDWDEAALIVAPVGAAAQLITSVLIEGDTARAADSAR